MDAAWPALCEMMEAAESHRGKEMERIMKDAMAQGDYLQIVEAGQRVFYSEGLVDENSYNDEEKRLEQRDTDERVSFPTAEMGQHVEFPDVALFDQAFYYDFFI
ncbi:hypothetical protein NLG97_g11170 [Lecanicillium saksenae]|uniref:Uncharacterized protein n=1 Tax=Lecanicillium saksenae TaxID=468837 RepID=A0ACC1QB54_9HYPO|nr:hypothetical protein NLG97_g11170 [Lecanicillium saksenae]